MFWAFFNSFASAPAQAKTAGASKPGINSPALTSPSMQPSLGVRTSDRDLSGPKMRALVKSPAKKPAKAASKPVTKVTPKKPVKKPVPVAKAKPPAKKAAVKSLAAPVKKPVAKPTPKPTPKPTAKSTPKPIAKSAAKSVAATPAPAKSSKPVKPVLAPTPPVVVTPSKPVGKRAAKKVMMEQMTQAVVVPTHAPDAAKATFSQTPERFITPVPVQTPAKKDAKRANNWKTTPVEQLADADVMAMPDSEYMNDVQQAFFRRKLQQLKADMLANAGETTEHLREDTSVMPDPADRATIEEEHALELRTRDRERKLLKKIEQAIVRIDAGDYGYCDETGEPIGVGRLMARPTANLSLEAQQRRELKQKMFGD
jgi:DnaK suppressor protein